MNNRDQKLWQGLCVGGEGRDAWNLFIWVFRTHRRNCNGVSASFPSPGCSACWTWSFFGRSCYWTGAPGTVAAASAVFRHRRRRANRARIWEASWARPSESSRGGGDAAGDGGRGDGNARADRTACTAPGWPRTGTRDCWPRAPPPWRESPAAIGLRGRKTCCAGRPPRSSRTKAVLEIRPDDGGDRSDSSSPRRRHRRRPEDRPCCCSIRKNRTWPALAGFWTWSHAGLPPSVPVTWNQSRASEKRKKKIV